VTSRRQFITGCSAAIAAMAGGRVGNLVFANPAESGPAAANDNILVTIFLRGGCDGLSMVAPFNDPIYQAKRGSIAVPDKPETYGGALEINPQNSTYSAKSNFGLHPSTGPLRELYDAGKLALIHSAGLNNDTRSHFDAMDYMERGTPNSKHTATGWLTRHLQVMHPDGMLPTLSAGSSVPSSLLGEPEAVSMNDPRSYGLSGPWQYTSNSDSRYKDAMLNTATKFYSGNDLVQDASKRTIETIKALRGTADYVPITTYPSGGFGDSLKAVAQMIKLDLGLRVATVDLGGWDHHENEGVNDLYGPFYRLAGQLAQGLHAFYSDLPDQQNKLTVVVMSEFGRRLGLNQSSGTDHGHGNMMMVLGGQVNGGKMYGTWKGLETENLDQGQDLAITTDFRTVLSEIVVRQLGNIKLGTVFPSITPEIYSPATKLNIVNGPDLEPDYTSTVGQVFVPLLRR
jgi:uncharacterized protein (DUF1501 family)